MTDLIISTNILRDDSQDIQYIATPNSKEVFNKIHNEFRAGQHAFNIIGSYGTGKSSFLWAFEKNLSEAQPYFAKLNGQFKGLKNFSFLKIIGDYTPLSAVLKEEIGLESKLSNKKFFAVLEKKYQEHHQKGELLVLILDEFGKFLEYAASNEPEKELYFIQQLSEFCNNPDRNILLITTLHQNFATYAKSLDRQQKKEWQKVKGRLKDITFDEPVEQLLLLASIRISKLGFKKPNKADFGKLFDTINYSKLISNSTNLDKQLAERLYPLDYLSAYILSSALQRYGQNERSLFSFLASPSEDGLLKFDAIDSKYYGIDKVYDYIFNHLNQELNDIENPHRGSWQSIYDAIDKVEVLNLEEEEALIKIIKSIGLVNIFCKKTGILDEQILNNYLYRTQGLDNALELIDVLKKKRIIKFLNFRKKLHFLGGTDTDIEKELSTAEQNISESFSVVERLKFHLDQDIFIAAKKVQYEKGTPRFFKFRFIEDVESKIEEPVDNEIDGYINFIIGDAGIKDVLLNKGKNQADIYALAEDASTIKKKLIEIEKIDYVLKRIPVEDKIARRILNQEKLYELNRLRDFFNNDIFNSVTWIALGQVKEVNSRRALNKLVSEVADTVYYGTPTYRNEMVNKAFISSPIQTARKELVRSIFQNVHQYNLGFPEDKFPPQKTIFLSLLQKTGIHREEEGVFLLGKPTDASFKYLWDRCEGFLDQSKEQKKSVAELYLVLSKPPFKLRKGFLDFWISLFLIIKNEHFAIFYQDKHEEKFVPYLTHQLVDLILKRPDRYFVKTYQIEGIKSELFERYKQLTKLDGEELGTETYFIKIYSNFLNFLAVLPKYTLRSEKLSAHAKKLRLAINKSKDPEDALFNQLPKALGFHAFEGNAKEYNMGAYLEQLNKAIQELRTAYDNLLDRIENELLKSLSIKQSDFISYKGEILQRFSELNKDLLNQSNKVLYNRLLSKLDLRAPWLESVADAILGKSINSMSSEEEHVLFSRIKPSLLNLEKLIPLHKLQQDRKDEKVQSIKILGADGEEHQTKIISFKDSEKLGKLSSEIESVLGSDREENQAALLEVLKKMLKE